MKNYMDEGADKLRELNVLRASAYMRLREQKALGDGPALFCNRFFITVGTVVRITFAEQEAGTTKEPHFRTAVALGHQDALALSQVLAELLKPFKEQIEAP